MLELRESPVPFELPLVSTEFHGHLKIPSIASSCGPARVRLHSCAIDGISQGYVATVEAPRANLSALAEIPHPSSPSRSTTDRHGEQTLANTQATLASTEIVHCRCYVFSNNLCLFANMFPCICLPPLVSFICALSMSRARSTGQSATGKSSRPRFGYRGCDRRCSATSRLRRWVRLRGHC